MASRIERKYMAHFIDTNTGSGQNWYRIGEDLEEYDVELNPEVEIERDMLGNEYIIHDNYEPTSDGEPFYARKGDALFNMLQGIVDGLSVGSACTTYSLDVHMWDENYAAVTSAAITDNPKTKGWFEKVNNKYIPSTDTTYDSNKTYYYLYFPAIMRSCYITPISYGGDTSGYQIPFTIKFYGDPISGTYDTSEKTFTSSN